jgi:hypothetical protein
VRSGSVRLEKRNPPPLPAGPDARPAFQLDRAAPSGPHVRVLDREDPDLTADDRAQLGAHANAILLTWGWHAEHRAQDPRVAEFRVYTSRHRLDARRCAVTAVTEIGPGRYVADVELDRDVIADASAGLVFTAGYPFHLRAHAPAAPSRSPSWRASRTPTARSRGRRSARRFFPVRLTPDATRAATWEARVQVVKIEPDRDVYAAAPIFDLLDLSPTHPRDEVMVGVSAADAEPYVDDPLAPAATRSGNEGAIAVVPVPARYRGRPVVAVPPALAPVPEIVTPFPGPRPLSVRLDVTPFLPGSGFTAGQPAMPERAILDDVVRAYRVDADGRLLARVLEPRAPGDAEREVVVPNPIDRAAVLAAFADGRSTGSPTRTPCSSRRRIPLARGCSRR